MNTGEPRINRAGLGLLVAALIATLPLAAASFDAVRHRDNRGTDGLNGELQSYGMLVSAPCVLAPESLEQTVDLGTTVISALKDTGDVTVPVDVHIVLEHCPGGTHQLENRQDIRGGLWLADQSAVRMRVIGEPDPVDTRFFRVRGASGVSLRIEDPQGRSLTPAVASRPLALNQGRNDIVFRAQLWRNGAPLDAGTLQAVVHIDMEYD